MSLSNRTLTIERTFNAPIQLVWDAWTRPEHLSNWWGPKGMETLVVTHKLEVGGQWKFIMQMPNGSEFVAEGEYEVIEPPKKLITSANFRPMTEGVTMEILLEADGERTKFTFNVIHPTEEYCKQQEAMGFYNGWGSTFDRLDELLAESS